MAGWPANAPIDTKRALAGDLETLSQQFGFRQVSPFYSTVLGSQFASCLQTLTLKLNVLTRGIDHALDSSHVEVPVWPLRLVISGERRRSVKIPSSGTVMIKRRMRTQRAQCSRMGASCADQGWAASCAVRTARAGFRAAECCRGSRTSFDEAHRAEKGIQHFARASLSLLMHSGSTVGFKSQSAACSPIARCLTVNFCSISRVTSTCRTAYWLQVCVLCAETGNPTGATMNPGEVRTYAVRAGKWRRLRSNKCTV